LNRTFTRSFYGLPYDVEYSLVRLFERELEFVRNIAVLIKDVNLRYDFNLYDLFRGLDIYNLDYITLEGYFIS